MRSKNRVDMMLPFPEITWFRNKALTIFVLTPITLKKISLITSHSSGAAKQYCLSLWFHCHSIAKSIFKNMGPYDHWWRQDTTVNLQWRGRWFNFILGFISLQKLKFSLMGFITIPWIIYNVFVLIRFIQKFFTEPY